MGFLEVLTLIFVTLKLTDTIAWSWLAVFSPLLIGYGLALLILALGAVLRAID